MIAIAALVVAILLIAAGWTAWRAKTATTTASELTGTLSALKTDAASGDLPAVSNDLRTLHEQAS